MRQKPAKYGPEPLKVLSKFRSLIEQTQNFERLPRKILRLAKEVSGADQVGFYLWDETRQKFIAHAIEPRNFFRDRNAVADFFEYDKLDGTIAQAIRHGRPFLISDIDKYIQQGGKTYKVSEESKSELVIPIFYKGAVLGAFCLSSDLTDGLTPEDESLFSAVASFLGIAYKQSLLIEQAQSLNEDTGKRARFLSRVGAIQSNDLEDLYSKILEYFDQMLRCKFISVWLFTELDGTFILRKFYRPPRRYKSTLTLSDFERKILRKEECLMGRSLRFSDDTKEVIQHDVKIWIRMNDKWVEKESKESLDFSEYKNAALLDKLEVDNLVSLPLMKIDGRAIGVFCIHPEDFEDLDKEILEALASGISKQIELVQANKMEVFRETLLKKRFPRIVTFEDSIDSWNELAMYIMESLYCEACSIFIFDPDKNILELKGTTGMLEPGSTSDVLSVHELGDVHYGWNREQGRIEGSTGYCLHTGKCYLKYAQQDKIEVEIPTYQIHKYGERVETEPPSKSLIFVPIYGTVKGAKKPIGVIRCVNKRQLNPQDFNRFEQEDVDVLDMIAHTISMFLANYRIMQAKDKQKDEFLETVTHEVLTPLTAITGHANFLKEFFSTRPRSEITKKFQDLVDEADHLTFIVSSIPTYIGIEEYRFERTKIFTSSIFKCASITENMRKDKNIRLEWDEEDIKAIPPLYLDQRKIHRVIYNIIMNAIKYSNANTSIRIRARREPTGCYLSFENYGMGVPKGEGKKIFERYQRGSNVKGIVGTGWGLTICRMVMQRHNGEVTLHRNNNPTIFTLFFPWELKDGSPQDTIHR